MLAGRALTSSSPAPHARARRAGEEHGQDRDAGGAAARARRRAADDRRDLDRARRRGARRDRRAHRQAARAASGGRPRGDDRRAAALQRRARTSAWRARACARRSARWCSRGCRSPARSKSPGRAPPPTLRAVGDAMLLLGAEQVLLDGAIDRRAASSPAVADGLVMATGAILSEDIEDVVRATATPSTWSGCRPPATKTAAGRRRARPPRRALALDRRLVLNAEPARDRDAAARASARRAR